MLLRRTLPLLALLTAGCAGHRAYFSPDPSATVKAEARAPGCPFELLAAPPARPYDTLGVVDVELSSNPLSKPPREPLEFRRYISAEVCAAGGDAVIAKTHGDTYVSGTVIKYRAATH